MRLQTVDDLGFTFRAKHGRAVTAFHLTHLVGQAGAPVQQGQQFQVNGVDAGAKFREGFCHGVFQGDWRL